MEQVVPGILHRLRATDIIRMAGLTVASLGQEYCRIGMVHNMQRRGTRLSGTVDVPHMSPDIAASPTNEAESLKPTAVSQRHYIVQVEIESSTACKSTCSCSPGLTTPCPHAAALLYQWLARPTAFTITDEEEIHDQAGQDDMLGIPQFTHSVSLAAPLLPAPDFPAISPRSARPPGIDKSMVKQRGPVSPASIADVLSQTGLGELRTIAREFDIATNGVSKQQIIETLLEVLRQPEVVRRVAATLEKPQRQLLAALVLAGGAMADEDLRGVFERFALGQQNQFQDMMAVLQGKGLLFRTNLSSLMPQRIGLSGVPLDIGWYVPPEVRSALRVTVPITPFSAEEAPTLQLVKPYSLLANLLLVARALDGYQLVKEDEWAELGGRNITTQSADAFSSHRLTGSFAADGAMTIFPSATLSTSLLASLQAVIARSPTFLRFAVRLLSLADILYKENGTPSLRVLPGAAELLLGPAHTEVARDLFALWLTHPSAEELFALQEKGLHLRCRTTSLNYPLLRNGELEAENSEARQAIVALLTQVPLHQWIHFPAFARFVYRLTPLFLQRRQRLFSSPHWWIEQEGRLLHPLQWQDWLRAEFSYLTELLCGPLHWWGICDLALAPDGRLLAFRLTPSASWLLSGIASEITDEEAKEQGVFTASIEVVDTDHVLIPCVSTAWPLLQVIEKFAQVSGVRAGRLCYRLAPQSLSEALCRGQNPALLLDLLRALTPPDTQPSDPLPCLLAQLERWTANYGRVRLYTDAVLLEVADAAVARELAATTSLDEQMVRTLQPTTFLLKKTGAARMTDDLKRRGQSPLLHDEDVYGAE
jgi:hypothetical protein